MYKTSIKNIIANFINRAYLHFKNYCGFLCFFIIKPIIKSKHFSLEKHTILFFNNGQIGDLLVSSIILENEDLFPKTNKYVFLIKEEYFSLFKNYRGLFEIKTYNLSEYRFNIKYKLKLINELNNLGITKFFNLCAARGILTEELSYFINSQNKYCLNKDSFFLDKFLIKYFNNIYKELYFERKSNEYDKTLYLIKTAFKVNSSVLKFNNNKLFDFTIEKKEYVVISPFSSTISKDWDIKKFNSVISILSKKYKIIIIGIKKENDKRYDNIAELDNVENLLGKTSLMDVVKLIAKCSLFIGNDSGMTHLALKLNKPIIAIVGGGGWNRFFPYYTNLEQKYITHFIDCFGCEWVCKLKTKYCLSNIEHYEIIDCLRD